MELGVNKTRVSRRHRLARRRLGAKWSSHVPAAGERQVWRRARAGRGEQGRRQEPRGSQVTRTAPFWLPSRLRLPPAGSRHGLQKEAPHMRCFTAPLPHHGRACASACLGRGPRDTGTRGGQPRPISLCIPPAPCPGPRGAHCLSVGATTRVSARWKPAGESALELGRPAGGEAPKHTEALPGNPATQGPADEREAVVRALPVCVLEARLPTAVSSGPLVLT